MLWRTEIRVTRDMQEASRIKELLATHGIECSVAVPTMARTGHSYHGIPFIKSSAMYEYHISVKRKDAELARSVLKSQ